MKLLLDNCVSPGIAGTLKAAGHDVVWVGDWPAHSGIIRLVNFSLSQHASLCLDAIAKHGADLVAGAIVTAEPGRLRLRPAPSTDPLAEPSDQ